MRALDEGVEDVEDGVAAPGVGVFAQEEGVFACRVGTGDTVAVTAEGFKLVDELVDDIPGPERLSTNSQPGKFLVQFKAMHLPRECRHLLVLPSSVCSETGCSSCRSSPIWCQERLHTPTVWQQQVD